MTDQDVEEDLIKIASLFYTQLAEGEIPSFTLPLRTRDNIVYDEKARVWVYGGKEGLRSAKTVKGAFQILKTAFLIEFLKKQLDEGRSSTLRELYYISENWEDAKFNVQSESDLLIEDLEIVSQNQREHFHIRPEEDGASVFGPLKVKEQTRKGEKVIHCQDDVGDAGYLIPNNIDKVEFLEHDAKMIVAVETGGMRDRLIENGFDEEFDAIIIHLKGQPARSTRRLLKRLNLEMSLPVFVFTDCDPWSYRIFASVAYGSIKSAHLSKFMATPDAVFMGIMPSDIVKYDLPTDKLTDQDKDALHSELKDPRFNSEFWKKEIKLQLELGKKSEQQSLAKYGLDFVTNVYLPERLDELG
jgi:DNA topoisomerase-6 subunit A